MHAWGQDRFMVRSFDAMDRLLWIAALAHALMVLALRDGKLASFRDQAIRLLKRQAATIEGRPVSLADLAAELDRQATTKRDYVVPSRLITMDEFKRFVDEVDGKKG